MKIEEVIHSLFSDNTNYKTPGQATNQASSLISLSSDLYTDSKRFIYELLQNADDSAETEQVVKVWIKIFGDTLVVAHTGKAFNSRDLRGLCNINDGTKKDDLSKTGYKGIGFKSVFGQADKVTIFTNNEYFIFDSSYPFDWIWEGTKEVWEAENDRKFVNPWQIIPIYTKVEEGVSKPIDLYLKTVNANVATIIQLNNKDETLLAIQELSENVNMFLFLKNISSIKFDVQKLNHVEINRSVKNRIVLSDGQNNETKWLTSSINLDVPESLKIALQDERNMPEKLLEAKTIQLTLAAKMNVDGIIKLTANDKRIYSYLPTEETKYPLPVLVNTSFLTNANREHLHADSKWNQWLFKSIAIEIFKWISQLVETEFQYQAYRLIPDKLNTDELGKQFNKGIEEAVDTVHFVKAKQGHMVKIKDSIIDFTFLSEKDFIGEKTIKNFVDEMGNKGVISSKVFVRYTTFESAFKRLGASSFEWKDFYKLLNSTSFNNTHSILKNIELIKHLKYISEKGNVLDISMEKLNVLPFLWDHKNTLNSPSKAYFPTANDTKWDNLDSDLSFLHKKLQDWLSLNLDIRSWIEELGVVEKTDISFVTKTIIPNVEDYINTINAIQTIRDIFSLYIKNQISTELLSKLSDLKLLTINGSLLKAKDCFFSNIYSPRLKIQKVLECEHYISEKYLTLNADIDEWKRFFKRLGVNEGIICLKNDRKVDVNDFVQSGCLNEYFTEKDKKFTPFVSTFLSDSYRKIVSLKYIHNSVGSYAFSKVFWDDVIENIPAVDLTQSAIAYWGRSGYEGQISGDHVINYIPWFIKNLKCIPVVTKTCESSNLVFLNTEEMLKMAGHYLPIFDGVELTPNWLSFFDFKTTLELTDYLGILNEIAKDITEKGEIKKSNLKRIQSVYKELMSQCTNWSEEELEQVSEWAKSSELQSTNCIPKSCSSLNYFLDGNNNVFHEQFDFLELNAENKNNPNLKSFLKAFNIRALKQSDFELVETNSEKSSDLIAKLKTIFSYFKVWVVDEHNDDDTKENLIKLIDRLSKLDILEADSLQIKYGDIDFIRSVNVHFDENKLYVTKPWDANRVLIQLSEKLCSYFELVGHDKKLDFLLRSGSSEINEHFRELGLDIPDAKLLTNGETALSTGSLQESLASKEIRSFEELEEEIESKGISPNCFHIPSSDYKKLKYVQRLISRAVQNIINYLDSLAEYDCSNHYEIAKSIIGGITKNGRDITIVARPSDNDEVILYYTAEFDVLEYVDAELWCEDGTNVPHKITLGQFLKLTEINKIPVSNVNFTDTELSELCQKQKSINHEFNAVPLAPFQIAKTVASFANTEGGTLVFGINEVTSTHNETVGLSSDFRIGEIITEAFSFLSPKPDVTCDWIDSDSRRLFVIKTVKSIDEICLGNQVYIREGVESILKENVTEVESKSLSVQKFSKTVAIVIAIENYANKDHIKKVKYAERDALLFKDTLINRMGVEEENIHLFLNEDALKSSLQYNFQGLFHELSSEDRLVFYYVGHGFHNGITNYLSTFDMHPHHVDTTAISLREVLLDPLSKSKCKSAMIFIDACAQSFEDENRRNTLSDLDGDEIKLLLSEHNYLASYFSCQPGQSSYSCDELQQGVWTYHLSNAIDGGVQEVIVSDEYITDRSLSDYLAKTVATYVKSKLGHTQNPKSILDTDSENVLVQIS
jgi:hypothetical protein